MTNRGVYIVHAPRSGLVKLGWSANVRRRFAGLVAHSPEPLELRGVIPGTIRTETALHAYFDAWRDHGEWFRDDVLEELLPSTRGVMTPLLEALDD